MKAIAFLCFVIGASGAAWAQQILVQNTGEFTGARFESAILNDAGGVSFLVQQNNYRIYTLQPGAEPVLYAEQNASSVQDEGLISISRLLDYDDTGTVVFSGYLKLMGAAERYAALLLGPDIDTSGGLAGDTIYDCLDGRCDAGPFTIFTEADYRAGDVAYALRLPAGNHIVSVRSNSCSFVACFTDNVSIQNTSTALLGSSNVIWLQQDDQIFRNQYAETIEEEQLGELGLGRVPRGFQFNGQDKSTYYEDTRVYRVTATGSTQTLIDVSALPMPGNKEVRSAAIAPSGDVAFAVDIDEPGTPEKTSIY